MTITNWICSLGQFLVPAAHTGPLWIYIKKKKKQTERRKQKVGPADFVWPSLNMCHGTSYLWTTYIYKPNAVWDLPLSIPGRETKCYIYLMHSPVEPLVLAAHETIIKSSSISDIRANSTNYLTRGFIHNSRPHTCHFATIIKWRFCRHRNSQILGWSDLTSVEKTIVVSRLLWHVLCLTNFKKKKGEKEYGWNPGWEDSKGASKGTSCKSMQHTVPSLLPREPDVESEISNMFGIYDQGGSNSFRNSKIILLTAHTLSPPPTAIIPGGLGDVSFKFI